MQKLPLELQNHILQVSQGVFAELVPRKCGTTSSPFFEKQAQLPNVPRVDDRVVQTPMPSVLRTLYAKYASNVEFSRARTATAGEWVFLSETEMHDRWKAHATAGQTRMVDLAVSYIGMGHISVLAYDPKDDVVFMDVDGGSNPLDRHENTTRRNACDVSTRTDRTPFEAWWRDTFQMPRHR